VHTPALLPVWQRLPDDAERTISAIDAWASSVAMSQLVSAFGGACAEEPGDSRLDRLNRFAATNWDFRRGRERNFAAPGELTTSQERLVLDLAADLGLAGVERPTLGRYDTIVLTGGMVRAGIVKPRFAAELLAGGLVADHVVFLGAFRPFAGDELVLARALRVDGDNEFSAMVTGMERVFGPLGEPAVIERLADDPNASWRELVWESPLARLSVVAAPSSDPQRRRANSIDTYRFWAEHRRGASERSVLQVTTPIYVPYQAAAAVEILGVEFGLAVETVGVSAAASDLGALSQPFRASHHLQELRAAIGAMRSLRARLARVELT
jgi:hypothetical protein